MADPRDVEYEEFDGASPAEQLIHAARDNNVALMQGIVDECKSEEEAADLLNNVKDRTGMYLYHIAAKHGVWEVIDWLTEQDGFECDPIWAAIGEGEGDTPLHTVIRFINDLEPTPTNWAAGQELVELMLDAGNEKYIKNKRGLTPVDLVATQNPELKKFIVDHRFKDEKNEYPVAEKHEVNYLDFDEVAGVEDDDEGGVYSGSDSEGLEEFNKRKEERARKAAS